MSKDPKAFKAPFISPQACWDAADAFRKKYWPSASIPIDVMDIAEFGLDLRITTIDGLQQDADMDAYLASDWTELVFDKKQYMDSRYLNRLRFSVAHELGHFVLHKTTFESIRSGTIDEWIRSIQEMPDKEYSLLEYHANEFAGRLLVPPDVLRVEFEKVLVEAEKSGIQRARLTDAHLGYVCKPVAKVFAVSEDVIIRRLQKEKLWPV